MKESQTAEMLIRRQHLAEGDGMTLDATLGQ
jgi:hypothetical protein